MPLALDGVVRRLPSFSFSYLCPSAELFGCGSLFFLTIHLPAQPLLSRLVVKKSLKRGVRFSVTQRTHQAAPSFIAFIARALSAVSGPTGVADRYDGPNN